MSEKIGYNDGLTGFVSFMRKIPGVRYRDQDSRPSSLSEWYWLEKLERTLRILKDAHDAAIVMPEPPPPPPPPPPPTAKRLAPQTYNKGSRGQDARYCINAPGVTRVGSTDRWIDEGRYTYNIDGLCDGGRSGAPVAGLKPSDMMDGKGPCDPYTWGEQSFPPWPPGSYEV